MRLGDGAAEGKKTDFSFFFPETLLKKLSPTWREKQKSSVLVQAEGQPVR